MNEEKDFVHVESPAAGLNLAPRLLPDWLAEMKTPRPIISSTVSTLDSFLGGLFGLVVMGGGPGTGKTALAIQIAENYAAQGGPVIFLSYEQGVAGFFMRMFQRHTGISGKDQWGVIQGPQGPVIAQDFAAKVAGLTNLVILGMPADNEGIDRAAMKEQINTMKAQTGKTALVVVDSLHYTPLGAGGAGLDGKRAIDEKLSIFTNINQETGAVVLMISHQTKDEVKAKENGLMSYSGSATIPFAVDMAIQLKRVEDADKRPLIGPNGEAYLKISVPKTRLGPVWQGEEIAYNLQRQTIGQ